MDCRRIARTAKSSAAARRDPVAEVRLAQIATGDGADDPVGLVRVARCRHPRPAVALDELDRRQERAALVPVGQRMVLDQVPAEDRDLGLEVGVRLNTTEASLRRAERRLGQSNPIEVAIVSADSPSTRSAMRR